MLQIFKSSLRVFRETDLFREPDLVRGRTMRHIDRIELSYHVMETMPRGLPRRDCLNNCQEVDSEKKKLLGTHRRTRNKGCRYQETDINPERFE